MEESSGKEGGESFGVSAEEGIIFEEEDEREDIEVRDDTNFHRWWIR